MLDRGVLVTKPAEGIRAGCQYGRCSCLELRQPQLPMTMAESWLIRRGWPEDHEDDGPRMKFIRTFSFAVITGAAIQLIRQYGPILEVGAGTGYWAMELSKAGVNAVATDPTPGMYFDGSPRWSRIDLVGGLEAMEKHPGRNLLLCWPEMEAWPAEVVADFSGKHVIYIGEPRNGCTGNDRMFDLLEERYQLEARLEIPRFKHMHDEMEIWRRR